MEGDVGRGWRCECGAGGSIDLDCPHVLVEGIKRVFGSWTERDDGVVSPEVGSLSTSSNLLPATLFNLQNRTRRPGSESKCAGMQFYNANRIRWLIHRLKVT
jgi:hypothetical protein